MEFSVLMSLYYREKPENLDDCFDSLLKQSVPAAEIVLVIDGAIGPELQKILDKWENQIPLKIFPLERNIGLGLALRYGLDKCSHEIVMRMDTDDICISDRFEIQIAYFRENRDLVVLGSYIDEIDSGSMSFISTREVPLDYKSIRKYAKWKNPFNHVTVAFRKSKIIECGSYRHLQFMEDYALWIKVLSKGYHCQNIPQSLVRVRAGREMLARRRGKSYLKSEWILFKEKRDLKLHGIFLGFLIYILRCIPRLLPSSILEFVYKLNRRNKR